MVTRHNVQTTDGRSVRLVGTRIVELRLSTLGCAVRLYFVGDDSSVTELSIGGPISIGRGESTISLSGAIPGLSFDPKQLSPLAELLGALVTEATVDRGGELSLGFEHNLVLHAGLEEDGYPAWSLRSLPKIPL